MAGSGSRLVKHQVRTSHGQAGCIPCISGYTVGGHMGPCIYGVQHVLMLSCPLWDPQPASRDISSSPVPYIRSGHTNDCGRTNVNIRTTGVLSHRHCVGGQVQQMPVLNAMFAFST